MAQSPFQRRLHLHLPELADSEIEVVEGLSLDGRGKGEGVARAASLKYSFYVRYDFVVPEPQDRYPCSSNQALRALSLALPSGSSC